VRPAHTHIGTAFPALVLVRWDRRQLSGGPPRALRPAPVPVRTQRGGPKPRGTKRPEALTAVAIALVCGSAVRELQVLARTGSDIEIVRLPSGVRLVRPDRSSRR
jgi:hypothetical protein